MGSKLEKVYWLLKIWITQLKIHPPPLISLLSWHNHRYFNLNILSSSVGWVIPDGVTGLSFSWLFTWLLDVMTWTLHQFTGSFELHCPSNLLSWLSDDKRLLKLLLLIYVFWLQEYSLAYWLLDILTYAHLLSSVVVIYILCQTLLLDYWMFQGKFAVWFTSW